MNKTALRYLMRNKFYALGWSFTDAWPVLLKHLHHNPSIDFKISGIVLDEALVDQIDDIPVIATQDFLKMEHRGAVALVPFTDNAEWVLSVYQSMNPKPVTIEVAVLTRYIAAALEAEGRTGIPIGPLTFPDLFEGQKSLLPEERDLFADEQSKAVYDKYLEFLKLPGWLCFEGLISPPNRHFFEPDWFMMSGFEDRTPPRRVIELASGTTALPEEFLPFMPPNAQYHLVLDKSCGEFERARHQILLGNLSSDFMHYHENINTIDLSIWSDPTLIVIVSRALSEEDKAVLEKYAVKVRIIFCAGDRASNFRRALDLSRHIHIEGKRKLRIAGRYPDSLFFFSSPD